MRNKTSAPATHLPALRIGSRVRCTDDGVTGRIVWANGVSVKITWDDGEQVTWRRDALADRPLEVLDPEQAGDVEQAVPAESAPAGVAEAAPAIANTEMAEGAVASAAAEPATGPHPTPQEAVPGPLPAEISGDVAATGVPEPDVTPAEAATAGPTTE